MNTPEAVDITRKLLKTNVGTISLLITEEAYQTLVPTLLESRRNHQVYFMGGVPVGSLLLEVSPMKEFVEGCKLDMVVYDSVGTRLGSKKVVIKDGRIIPLEEPTHE